MTRPHRRGAADTHAGLLLATGLATVTVALCLPAIGPRLALDDYVLALVSTNSQITEQLSSAWGSFTFATGVEADNARAMGEGLLLPWWSDPQLKISFLRPLSFLLHWLDHRIWPQTPQIMYSHSLLWLAAMVFATCLLYQKLYCARSGGVRVAVLAAVFFALNDANGAAVSWLSNRNVLLGTVFCTLALSSHHSARTRSTHNPWTLIWVAAALSAGEIGVLSLCYLAAYALALDEGSPRRRLGRILPPLGLTLVWLGLRWLLGAGASGSGAYVNPWQLEYWLQLPERATMLLGAAFGPVGADLYFVGSESQRELAYWGALGTLILVAALYRLSSETRTARFWLLGTLLSTLPLCSTLPSDRLLPILQLGAMPLLAELLLGTRLSCGPLLGLTRKAAVAPLLVCQALVSPLLLPVQAGRVQLLARAMSRSFDVLDQVPKLEQRTLLVLGGPADYWVGYLQAERAWWGHSRPRNVQWVTHPGSFVVTAPAPNLIQLRAEDGFFAHPAARLYRPLDTSFEEGQMFEVPGARLQLSELTAGRSPRRIDLRLTRKHREDNYAVVYWHDGRYELQPKELNSPLHISAPSPLSLLLPELL